MRRITVGTGRAGRIAMAAALAALVAGGAVVGVAWAQKPPAAGQPAPPPAPGGKLPPQAGPAPGPAPAPAPAPVPPPAAPAPGGKLSGQAPAPPPPPAAGRAPADPPQAATPPATPPGSAAAPRVAAPLDEPTALGRLRSLLGSDAVLTYGALEIIDPARGTVRLQQVNIARGGETTTAEELLLDDMRDDGVGEASVRNLRGTAPDGTVVTLGRLQLVNIAINHPPGGGRVTPDQLSADSVRLEDLRIQAADTTLLTLGQITVEDYGVGREGRISLGNFEIRPADQSQVKRVQLGRMVVRGIDMANLLAAAVAQRIPDAPRAGRQALEMEQLTITGANDQPLGSVGSVRLTNDYPANGSALGNLAIRNIRVEPFPGIGEWLQRFGYTSLTMDLSLDSRFDTRAGRLEMPSVSLAGRDIGALSLAMVLDGIGSGADPMASMMSARLVSAGLHYVDQSLLGRVLRAQARQDGVTEQQLREQYAAMAGGALTVPGRNGLGPIREAVTRFIRGQATDIEVTARPPQPLPLASLQGMPPPTNAAEVQRMFGVTATAR